MNKNEFEKFYTAWIGSHAMSSSNQTPSDDVVMTVFELLADYPLQAVITALQLHSKKSRFAPTPHDVIEIMHSHGAYADVSLVSCPSHETIIALAKLADTPLGVLARIQIGSWDLNNQDSFYLRQRAEEVILKFDGYIAACVSGQYTAHELSMMKKYGADPLSSLAKGLPSPRDDAARKLMIKIDSIPTRTETVLKLASVGGRRVKQNQN